MSFQGADVSELDRIAHTCQQGADFAQQLAAALKLVVAALKAMSWTGWAAAYAAYLEGVVIPWIESTGRYLANAARMLQMVSSTQKTVSGDSPTVHIPAPAYQPVELPQVSTANPPTLIAPTITITITPGATGSDGGGAQVVTPGGPARTLPKHVAVGATGDGGGVTAPVGGGVIEPGSSGSGATGTPGAVPSGVAGDIQRAGEAITSIGRGVAGIGQGIGQIQAGIGALGDLLGGDGAHTDPGTGSGGGAGGGGTIGGGGSVGGELPAADPGPASDGAAPTTDAGPPAIGASTIGGSHGTGGAGTAMTGPGTTAEGLVVEAVAEESGGVPAAAIAAPIGLAGLGAAGLGALRGRENPGGGELPVANR